jgi:hypothetical protein
VGHKIVEVTMGAGERATRYCDAELRVHKYRDETGQVWRGGKALYLIWRFLGLPTLPIPSRIALPTNTMSTRRGFSQ